MLIDTHCHLDAQEFAEDRDALVIAARQADIKGTLIPGVAAENFAAVRDCCMRYPGCFPAYGFHPLYLERVSEADLLKLRSWLVDESVGVFPPVAIGEIGLDFFKPGFDATRQEYFFVEQLKIAKEMDLPVLLHVRRAVDLVLKCLRRIGVQSGIAHAFNGSRQQADEFIRLGFKLGFGGAMTYPGSTRIRKLAATLPLDAVVLETDAPDIPPYWLAGRRNTPIELHRIALAFSELRGLSVGEVSARTSSNALALFKFPLVA